MAKKKCPEFENHERWLVSYADMLTLLFALFVVLYALKEDGKNGASEAAGSIQDSFDKPLEEIPLAHRIGPVEAGFGIFDKFKGSANEPSADMSNQNGKPRKKIIIDEDMLKTRKLIQERLYGPNRHPRGDVAGSSRLAQVKRTGDGFKVELLASHFFRSGSAKLTPRGVKSLKPILNALKPLERKITIEGHTDSLPLRGQFSNWDLSALRATSVLQTMIEDYNFPPTSLRAAGYGSSRPLASNITSEGRSLNRRIEIKVEYDDDAFYDQRP